jgi:hypothetical protein
MEALEERMMDLEEQADQDFEMVQSPTVRKVVHSV